jgi:hypothetical protein
MADKKVKNLDVENKKHMKTTRLQQYQMRYFELVLDREALIANNDTTGVLELENRMMSIENAYNAVDAIIIEEVVV